MNMKMLVPAVCTAVVALSLSPMNAHAQRAVTAYAGTTDVTLSSGFVGALESLNVKLGLVNPTMVSGTVASFPITGGAIDLDTASGNFVHSGGLTLEGGANKVRLQSFIIDTTASTPVITGIVIVNNKVVGRLPLFDLRFPAGFKVPLNTKGNTLALTGVGLLLDAKAAAALNSVYSVSAFTPGFNVGTAKVTAYVSSADWTY
jgi:hypothetical protein